MESVVDNATLSDNLGNVTDMDMGWQNASLYYSIQSDDPELKDCKPTVLKTELMVSKVSR